MPEILAVAGLEKLADRKFGDLSGGQAKSTLETAGLTVQCDAATSMQMPAMQESVLSLAVREAVTNVVRHAQARSCSLRIEQHNGTCRLEIADDGQGFSTMEGNGLRGMRERVEMLGGKLERRNKSGTTLTITLPLKETIGQAQGKGWQAATLRVNWDYRTAPCATIFLKLSVSWGQATGLKPQESPGPRDGYKPNVASSHFLL
jgi:hypothetical protein